jgi:hypothetical protein
MEDERQELEAVSAALANSSRLLRLITYIGDKYFHGERDKLHEYDIATEVFGRSKETFNSGEDAIVRVEASRLRKRLTEYYAGEGKDHPLHMSIPPGSYVPVFTRQSSEATLETETVVAHPGTRAWSYVVAIAAFGLTIITGYLIFRAYSAKKEAVGAAASNVHQTIPSNAAPYAEVPLRILAGYLGKPRIDSAGNVIAVRPVFSLWRGMGASWDSAAARTSDSMLFKHWRNGDFSYDIPLRPGVYELHLYFVAVEPASSDLSTFTIYVNTDQVLSNFDIRSDALGANIADERSLPRRQPREQWILAPGVHQRARPRPR